MIIDSVKIKINARELGADLCGITSAESFKDAPEGCKPTDIYSRCKSVIVFAKRMPPESMYAENCVPYTNVCGILARQTDEIGLKLCNALEEMGIGAVPVPSDDPYEYWDNEKQYGRGILSLKHAGYLAGLGAIGNNTLLTNKKLGNIMQLGSVLVDTLLDPDKPVDYSLCPENCRLCIDACPAKALDGMTVDQKKCRLLSNYRNERGFVLKKCWLCRKVCPNSTGCKP